MSFESFERYRAHLETCAYSTTERELARDLLADVLDGAGLVRFHKLGPFHQTLIRDYSFVLRQRTQKGVRPGGWHLFYIRYHLLLRVKTTGTDMRPRPHMTLSLAVGPDMRIGLNWEDELGKFSKLGDELPKVFSKVVHRDPSLWRYLPRRGGGRVLGASRSFRLPGRF